MVDIRLRRFEMEEKFELFVGRDLLGLHLFRNEPTKFNGFWISDGEQLEISPEKFPDVTIEDELPRKITVTLTY